MSNERKSSCLGNTVSTCYKKRKHHSFHWIDILKFPLEEKNICDVLTKLNQRYSA